jgi:hypothetical protein
VPWGDVDKGSLEGGTVFFWIGFVGPRVVSKALVVGMLTAGGFVEEGMIGPALSFSGVGRDGSWDCSG